MPQLESERDVGARRPPRDVRAPDIGSTDSDPLNFPELVEEIQHEAAVDLLHVLHAKAILEVTEQIRASEIATRSQLVAVDLRAKRDVQVDLGGHRGRAATDPDVRVGAVEALGVEVGRIG